MLVADRVASLLSMPWQFNDNLAEFLPKGEAPGDPIEVLRQAGDTRPLGLKNMDNKIIAAVFNHALKAPLVSSTSGLQRGFVPGR